jgi:hypothetical protein
VAKGTSVGSISYYLRDVGNVYDAFNRFITLPSINSSSNLASNSTAVGALNSANGWTFNHEGPQVWHPGFNSYIRVDIDPNTGVIVASCLSNPDDTTSVTSPTGSGGNTFWFNGTLQNPSANMEIRRNIWVGVEVYWEE